MTGGSTPSAVVNMRRMLSPYRNRGVAFINGLDSRAAAYLAPGRLTGPAGTPPPGTDRVKERA